MLDYKDIDGKPITLSLLVRTEPDWAVSRIERMTQQLAAVTAERDGLKPIVDTVYKFIDRMSDESPNDPLTKSAAEFVQAVTPLLLAHCAPPKDQGHE